MKKVVIIIGTRPEAIKLIPLYLYIKDNSKNLGCEPILISTGQHKEMLFQIFNFYEVQADYSLDVMTSNQTLVNLSKILLGELGKLVLELKPSVVVVQGDTTSALMGALVAFYSKIKVAHVEAGLRTYNRFSPYPEEVNRQMIGTMADFHFAPTQLSMDNLVSEKKQGMYLVGNTVIDSLQLCINKIEKNLQNYTDKFSDIIESSKYVLVTGHRRENFGTGFENICEALKVLATKHEDIKFIYPVHLNPNVRFIVNEKLSAIDNIKLIAPLPYDELVYLMKNCFIILTDSGGIQEEAPSLNKPLLVMRDTTERPEGITAGCAKLVGTSQHAIIEAFEDIFHNPDLYKKMSKVANPYGDGHASEKIALCLSNNV